MSDRILICTVGGSHQPIVTSIRELEPGFVCFLCTDRDPGTGQPGSRIQVEGKGNVIKVRPGDPDPTLPNIPAQTDLAADRYEVRTLPADDLDAAFSVIAGAIVELRKRFPNTRLIADYTGGTKTMTAALVMAALETPDVELRLVTGARANLVQVHDGTQLGVPAVVEGVRLRRAIAPYLSEWTYFGYGAAAAGLAQIPVPHDPALRAELQIARDLSAAFDAWDRFDHRAALARLDLYRPKIGSRAGLMLKFLEMLCLGDDDQRKEPARLLDLWLNAQRRAVQGRYDDAVARAYRLLEWTAQWLLRTRAGIDTSDVPSDKVPEGMALRPSREGRLQAGLYEAWRLAAFHLEGVPRDFARTEDKRLLDHLKARNASILAHGYLPIDAETWRRFHGWMEQAFIPMLRQAAGEAGVRMEPPQLPIAPIWESG